MKPGISKQSRLRVVHVNDTAGVATLLIEQLRASDVDCKLLVQGITAGDTYALLPKLLGSLTRMRSALHIRRQIRQFRPDIAHVHYSVSALWFLGMGCPLVIHAHGTDVRPLTPARWKAAINRFVCGRACRVLYSTPDLATAMQKLRIRASFLPNPIELAKFPVGSDQQASRDVLLFIRLNRIKGAEQAVSALRKLCDDNPALTVTVIGEGELLDQLDLTRFRVVAGLPHDQVSALIRDHRVIIGQLRLGTVSLSELEAMASGRPVIGMFNYPAAYPEPPPIVDVTNEQQLRDAVSALLNDPNERKRVGELGADWVRRHHGSRDVVAKLLALYRDILQC